MPCVQRTRQWPGASRSVQHVTGACTRLGGVGSSGYWGLSQKGSRLLEHNQWPAIAFKSEGVFKMTVTLLFTEQRLKHKEHYENLFVLLNGNHEDKSSDHVILKHV